MAYGKRDSGVPLCRAILRSATIPGYGIYIIRNARLITDSTSTHVPEPRNPGTYTRTDPLLEARRQGQRRRGALQPPALVVKEHVAGVGHGALSLIGIGEELHEVAICGYGIGTES